MDEIYEKLRGNSERLLFKVFVKFESCSFNYTDSCRSFTIRLAENSLF